jgi:hypothetical protein
VTVSRPPVLRVGDEVRLGGQVHVVDGLSDGQVRLLDVAGAASVMALARLLADPTFMLVCVPATAPLPPAGLLEGLPEEMVELARWWERHIVEVLTRLPAGAERAVRLRQGNQRHLGAHRSRDPRRQADLPALYAPPAWLPRGRYLPQRARASPARRSPQGRSRALHAAMEPQDRRGRAHQPRLPRRIHFREVIARKAHDVVIDEATFDLAQEILAQRGEAPKKAGSLSELPPHRQTHLPRVQAPLRTSPTTRRTRSTTTRSPPGSRRSPGRSGSYVTSATNSRSCSTSTPRRSTTAT